MPKYWDMGMKKCLFFSNNGNRSDPCCLLTPNSQQSFLETGQEEGTNPGCLLSAVPSETWWLVQKILKNFLCQASKPPQLKSHNQSHLPEVLACQGNKYFLMNLCMEMWTLVVCMFRFISSSGNSEAVREQHHHTQAHPPGCQDLALLTLNLVNVSCLCSPASTICHFLYNTGKITPQA